MRVHILALLLSLLMACSPPPPSGEPASGLFVVVRIPESLSPLERGAKYEDPLHAELRRRGVGEVSGGGTGLGPASEDGRREIQSVDIDVELIDAERGLPTLRAALKELDAPPGTGLSYERDGRRIDEPLW